MAHSASGPLSAEPCIRQLASSDSFDELTELLHSAYADLAAAGMRFNASHQDAKQTRKRSLRGDCFVAELAGQLVGTITLRSPTQTAGCAWYDRADVASFGQFGVLPSLRGTGLGSALLRTVESAAADARYQNLALDTAESASDLIAWYGRRGYTKVGDADWRPSTNYRSLILNKQLPESSNSTASDDPGR